MQQDATTKIHHEMVIRKCRCDSVWCPQCYKIRKVPKLYSRINDRLDWRSTRHIILTIDRTLFDTPEKAYIHITKKKAIPQLIHNLKRTKNIEIRDYVWILEWHSDGYPHWHLFADVTKIGKMGMIHFQNIQKYWNYGNVKETYFKNIKHWNKLVGYFGKHGYFEKSKGHQAILPDWARSYKRTIKRTGSASIQCHLKTEMEKQIEKEKKEMKEKTKESTKKSDEKFYRGQGMYPGEEDLKREPKERDSYHVLFEKCGKFCTATIIRNGMPFMGFNINLPYFQMRDLYEAGEMREGFGYVVQLSPREYNSFMTQFLPKFQK